MAEQGLLKGKRAIVTGGSLGIGAAVAKELAYEGANIALNYRCHSDEAEKVAEIIRGYGCQALVIKADVADFQSAHNMVSKVTEEWGGVDILVCNAGITRDAVLWKMGEEQWDEVISINLKGYFNYVRAVSPLMKEQGWGRIICITSINGLRGKFGQANYSAAKAGVIGLVKTAAKELGRYGVTVNAVAPGMILTDMMASLPEEIKQKALEETVVGRLGEPEDVAHLVTFLCSDKARHITGEVIKVDGGQYI
ncbi:MAG: 3-oxoacyl-[acyl-carrier-protein] reductase [bacterium]